MPPRRNRINDDDDNDDDDIYDNIHTLAHCYKKIDEHIFDHSVNEFIQRYEGDIDY